MDIDVKCLLWMECRRSFLVPLRCHCIRNICRCLRAGKQHKQDVRRRN